jgi:Holliday junction resolvase RusA-like endonuclease
MTLKLITLPPSTNHIYGRSRGGVFMNERSRRAKEAIGWEARSQYRGKPLTGPLKVSVALYWPDRRKHDVDNIKVLLDALTGIAWLDDGQIEDLRITKAYDKEKPRVEIAVSETL